MNKENVQTKFQIINLMLYNSEIIINNLDFKFKIFMLLNFCSINVASTNPIMLKIMKNVIQNFIELKSKIVIH